MRPCHRCGQEGTLIVSRTDYSAAIEMQNGKRSVSQLPDEVSSEVEEFAYEMETAADEAEMVQADDLVPSNGFYGTSICDHLLATCDTESMREAACKMRNI